MKIAVGMSGRPCAHADASRGERQGGMLTKSRGIVETVELEPVTQFGSARHDTERWHCARRSAER